MGKRQGREEKQRKMVQMMCILKENHPFCFHTRDGFLLCLVHGFFMDLFFDFFDFFCDFEFIHCGFPSLFFIYSFSFPHFLTFPSFFRL